MKNIPKVTIVIPVYKVGKYIENSMKSVINQRFTDFEVILVDNNTPDDSIEIAEKVLAGTNIYYRVVKQTIQGLPAARNKGIEEANGEWIVSIDPDDTISPCFLEELYFYANESKLPVVFGEYDEVEEKGLFLFPEEEKKDAFEVLDREYALNKLLTRELPLMVSNMFFKKSFFIEHGFQFDQGVILGADLMLVWRILLNLEKIGHLNKKLYNHFFRSDSLITAPSSKKIETNLAGYRRTCDYVAKNYNKEFSKWIYARELYGLLSVVCVHGEYKMLRANMDLYYTKDIHKSLQTFPDMRIVIMDKILYSCPWLFFQINKQLRQPNSLLFKLMH